MAIKNNRITNNPLFKAFAIKYKFYLNYYEFIKLRVP